MPPDEVVSELTGYADRLSAYPGERLSIYAAGEGSGELRLVQLHATITEGRAGFRAEAVSDATPVAVELHPQVTRHGSYATLPAPWAETPTAPVALELWVRPSWDPLAAHTAHENPGSVRREGTVGSWFWAGMRISLHHTAGVYQLRAEGDTDSVPTVLASVDGSSSEPEQWHRLNITFNPSGSVVSIALDGAEPAVASLPGLLTGIGERRTAGADQIVIGAASPSGPGDFDGRIANVRCTAGEGATRQLLADWDFGVGNRDNVIIDRSLRAQHGSANQLPVRGLPGPSWSHAEVDPRLAPDEFDATHFHRDDIADAGWEESATLELPLNLASGVYAAEISVGDRKDWIPFVVRSSSPASENTVAFLLSTFTYQAYANASLGDRIDYHASGISGREYKPGYRDDQIAAHPIVTGSLYDIHADGSGRRYSSNLRPIFNFRPDFTSAVQHAPRHLGADLFILDWLQRQGHDVAVLTDHDLHRDGYGAIEGVRAVVTSSHPEYVSTEMLDALTAHQNAGGSLMYLGGNGFYWVTAAADEQGSVIECIRANAGTRTWDSLPGETSLVSTGEPGGLWRHRGRAPNILVGIGMASQGSDEKAQPFRTTPGLLEDRPDLAFLFEGFSNAERFGENGLVMGGASGDELDRWDPALGSPLAATIVATSERHSKHYMLVHEDVLMSEIRLGADVNDRVRSDIIWWPTDAGGYVFSVGSITWAGAMGYRSFDNDCARLATNALNHIMTH